MKTACEVLNLVTCPFIVNNNLKDTSSDSRQFTFGFQLGQIEALQKVGLVTKEELWRARAVLYFLYYGMEIPLFHF